MKKLLLITLVLIMIMTCFAACGGEKAGNDAVGNISDDSQEIGNIENGMDDGLIEMWFLTDKLKNGSNYYHYEYDKNGNMTQDAYYLSDGSVSLRYDYEYDSNGNCIVEVETSKSNEKPIRTENTYDTKGNLIEFSNDGNFNIHGTYEYNDEGKIIKQVRDYSHGISTINEFEYDDYGNLITEIVYNAGDSENGNKFISEYDAHGNEIKRTVYLGGEFSSVTTNTYDDRGNLLEMIESDGSKTIFHATYTYDKNGNKLSDILYNEDALRHHLTYKYDESGKLIEHLEYDKNGNIAKKSVLEYNEAGLRIKKTEYVDGKEPIVITYKYVSIRVAPDSVDKYAEIQNEINW